VAQAVPRSDPTDTARAFEVLRERALTCTACRLCEGRTQVVFGTGDPRAELMFVGEGPGAEEDRQGLPFVGRSGKLLDRLMWEEMGLTRETAYIANVVKCRPPDNRDPKPDEIASCWPYLEAQVELIAPRVIVTLGNFASKLLLDTDVGITRLRGNAYAWGDAVLVPTLHPAAVLRGGGAAMANMRADLVRAKSALQGGTVELRTAESPR
jgi:DNA polymerase